MRGAKTTLAAIATALAVATAPQAATGRAQSGDVGFTHLSGAEVVFVLRSSRAPLLTNLPAANGQRIVWSSDGGRLALICADFALCVAEHGKVRELTHTGWPRRWEYDGDPAWSPDGKTLAFDANTTGGYRIYLVAAAGGQARPLVRASLGHEELPAWAPTGSRLAFDARVGHTDAIYVVGRDGRGLHRLTGKSLDAHSAAWSPDGKWIAFTSVSKQGSSIAVIPASGGHARMLTPGTTRDDHPAWSPDGKTVAFDSNRAGPIGIWTVPMTGGTPTQIDSGQAGPDLFPTWRATGGPADAASVPRVEDLDARLVSSFILESFRVGADVFALHTGKQAAIGAIARDAASAQNALSKARPSDARGRKFQAAARLAFTQAAVAARNYEQMLAALHEGQRAKAFRQAKAALRQLTVFGKQLAKANAIAGLP